MKKLIVFPNDSIKTYYKKGEIKPRYFNPRNFFDEVHIISLCDKEIAEKKVQEIVGKAKLKIYPVGKLSLKKPLGFFNLRKKVLELVEKISPRIIRAYNLRAEGYLATYCAKKLARPPVVSLHTNYNRWIEFKLYGLSFLKNLMRRYLFDKYFENYIIKNATFIIGVYEAALSFVKKTRRHGLVKIYNRVYKDDYNLKFKKEHPKIKIISVGRTTKQRDPSVIIKAIRDLDVELILIGGGELWKELKELAHSLGVENKVKFIEQVFNKEIPKYYLDSDIFALNYQYPGLHIPIIEAMAAALPVVISKPLFEKEIELIGDSAIAVESKPAFFKAAFEKLIVDKDLRLRLGRINRKRMEAIDGAIMEKKEVELYRKLLEK